MAYRFLLIGVLMLAFADPALANWWIVRAADEKCLVVDMEPSGNDKNVTKVGKDVYQTREQAEADVKKFCKESNAMIGLRDLQVMPSEVAQRRLCEAFDPNDLGIKDLSEEQDLSLKLSNDTELLGGVQGGYNWQMPNGLGSVEGV